MLVELITEMDLKNCRSRQNILAAHVNVFTSKMYFASIYIAFSLKKKKKNIDQQ